MSGKHQRAMDYAFCDPCGKRGYFTKKDAKVAHRSLHQGHAGLRIYSCPHRDLWHIGHIPRVVRERGLGSARDIFEDRRRRAQ